MRDWIPDSDHTRPSPGPPNAHRAHLGRPSAGGASWIPDTQLPAVVVSAVVGWAGGRLGPVSGVGSWAQPLPSPPSVAAKRVGRSPWWGGRT